MFSAGLPCLAYRYLCIEELVEDHKNGRLFSNEEELAEELFDSLKGFDGQSTGGTDVLRKYRQNLQDFGKDTWDDQWRKVMIPNVIRQ